MMIITIDYNNDMVLLDGEIKFKVKPVNDVREILCEIFNRLDIHPITIEDSSNSISRCRD